MLYVDKVSCADEGQNLIEFYTRRYPHSASELGWKHRLARGQVLVAKKVVKDSQLKLRYVHHWVPQDSLDSFGNRVLVCPAHLNRQVPLA
jgi:hypothetical protein